MSAYHSTSVVLLWKVRAVQIPPPNVCISSLEVFPLVFQACGLRCSLAHQKHVSHKKHGVHEGHLGTAGRFVFNEDLVTLLAELRQELGRTINAQDRLGNSRYREQLQSRSGARTSGPPPQSLAALRRMIADEEEAELTGTGSPRGDPCRNDGSGSQAGVERPSGVSMVSQGLPSSECCLPKRRFPDEGSAGAGAYRDGPVPLVPPCGAEDAGGSIEVPPLGGDASEANRCGTGDPGPSPGDPHVRCGTSGAGPLETSGGTLVPLGGGASAGLPAEETGSVRDGPLNTAEASGGTTSGTLQGTGPTFPAPQGPSPCSDWRAVGRNAARVPRDTASTQHSEACGTSLGPMMGPPQETMGTAGETVGTAGCAVPGEPAAGETEGPAALPSGIAEGVGRPAGTAGDPAGGGGGTGTAGIGNEGEETGEGGGRGDAASDDNSWHPETESEDEDEDDDDDDVRVCDLCALLRVRD